MDAKQLDLELVVLWLFGTVIEVIQINVVVLEVLHNTDLTLDFILVRKRMAPQNGINCGRLLRIPWTSALSTTTELVVVAASTFHGDGTKFETAIAVNGKVVIIVHFCGRVESQRVEIRGRHLPVILLCGSAVLTVESANGIYTRISTNSVL
jgi:hypothetical protein